MKENMLVLNKIYDRKDLFPLIHFYITIGCMILFQNFCKKNSIHEWRDIWQNLTKIWCKNIALEQAGVVNLFVKNKKLCRKANRKYLLLKISLNIWVKVLLFSQKLGVGERRSEVMQSYGLFGTCMYQTDWTYPAKAIAMNRLYIPWLYIDRVSYFH